MMTPRTYGLAMGVFEIGGVSLLVAFAADIASAPVSEGEATDSGDS